MKKRLLEIFMVSVMCLALCACQKDTVQINSDTLSADDTNKNTMEYTVKEVLSTELFTDEKVTEIDLKSQTTNLEIKAPGVYALTGQYSGQIIVNTADEGKVKLILNGVEIVNPDSACILVKNADKVIISSNKDSVNILSSTGKFDDDDNSNVDAAIFSHDDLTLSGEGTISLISSYGHGIVSKDKLKIKGGTLNITSEKKGINGKDAVEIEDGTIHVISGTHAIDSEGDIKVTGGDIELYSNRKDGVHADGNVVIENGTVTVLNSLEGLEGLTVTILGGTVNICSSDDGINSSVENSENTWQIGSNQYLTDDEADVTITGGNLVVNANGDGIDSNGTLNISGGTAYICASGSGENIALNAREEVIISGGEIFGLCSSQFPETFGTNSTQTYIKYSLDKTYPESTKIAICDKDGNMLMSFIAPRPFSSVLVSCPEMMADGLYTLNVGDDQFDV